jgi:hypothetical protein
VIATTPIEIYTNDRGVKPLIFELAEEHVREWFMKVNVEQARDTLKVCEGIVDARLTMKPKRVRRKDAGKPRPLNAKEMKDAALAMFNDANSAEADG